MKWAVLSLGLWCACALPAADPPLRPLRVCEVLADPAAYDGKPVALVGRFSFRDGGRFLGEETCDAEPKKDGAGSTPLLRVSEDAKSAPRPPQVLEIDSRALDGKLKEIRAHTALRKYRFGTPDYDRWAVVYGRFDLGKARSPASLVIRGDAVIVFINDR